MGRTQFGHEVMPLHLTDAAIRRLPTPSKGNKIHYDDDVKGFGCRVTAAGARSFILNYLVRGGGRERRFTIGRFPDWSATAARAKARELRRGIDDGGDPLADLEAEREAPTVTELCDRFEAEHLPRKRPGTAEDYRRMLRVWSGHTSESTLRCGTSPSATSTDCIDASPMPGICYRANRVIAVVSKMFALAVRWNMRGDNPCSGIERNIEHSRKPLFEGRRASAPDQGVGRVPGQAERLTSSGYCC